MRIQFQIRLSEDERSRLESLAKEWGCTMSEAVRRLIREQKLKQVDEWAEEGV